MRVFVYGSLLRGLHNHALLRSSPLLKPQAQTVERFGLVDSLEGYPCALRLSDAASSSRLLGEVYSVDRTTLQALDALEEHPSYYRREEVAVLDDNELAWLYILVDAEALAAARSGRLPTVSPPGDWMGHVRASDAAEVEPSARSRAAMATMEEEARSDGEGDTEMADASDAASDASSDADELVALADTVSAPRASPARLDASSWRDEPARAADRFRREHVRRSAPALLTGCVDHWPALRQWSHAHLRSALRDSPAVHVALTPDGLGDAVRRDEL